MDAHESALESKRIKAHYQNLRNEADPENYRQMSQIDYLERNELRLLKKKRWE